MLAECARVCAFLVAGLLRFGSGRWLCGAGIWSGSHAAAADLYVEMIVYIYTGFKSTAIRARSAIGGCVLWPLFFSGGGAESAYRTPKIIAPAQNRAAGGSMGVF